MITKPKWIRVILPLTVEENPGYMKEGFHITIETLHAPGDGQLENNPGYMKKNFIICIETLHAPDMGTMENSSHTMLPFFRQCCSSGLWHCEPGHCSSIAFPAGSCFAFIGSFHFFESEVLVLSYHAGSGKAHELTGEKYKMREVVPIDISNDSVKTSDYKADEDPTKFKSEKTGRGPLIGPEWWKKASCDPVMTCYKLVTCEFKWFGLQSRVEKFIQDVERRLFTNFHRQVFCWMDRWHGMTMDDIRRLEDKTKQELDKQRKVGEVRGTRSDVALTVVGGEMNQQPVDLASDIIIQFEHTLLANEETLENPNSRLVVFEKLR
ncbi:Phosphatidylinositol transfer protein alpha isoform [Portunus trituberculatus]|uniref:Phosphatidylinositol transfer protein alpha isoform n=1 Tax=Portunus trituberculatus TaxID=210409 RepID=A0A5B7CMX1_PORTR|nr:Phosphatidylinositol transfer protein alpha isoform [Portunus trituberculatus]